MPSLHPLYTPESLTVEPALLGSWTNDSGNAIWTFTQEREVRFLLHVGDDRGREGWFDVHMVKLESELFLDLYPKGRHPQDHWFYDLHYLPVHTFARIYRTRPTLEVALLDHDWVDGYLARHPGAVGHGRMTNDAVVLTAPAEELQRFLRAQMDAEGAFGERAVLYRKPPE